MKNTHLNYFGVKNFKSFKGEHWFHLKNITFLIGQNSSGKSSLIQALRIANSIDDNSVDLSDIGIKSNWLNDKSTAENVAFTNVAQTNVEFLNNKFYYFNTFYPEKKSHYIHGEVFKKFYGDLSEQVYDNFNDEYIEFDLAFFPNDNFFKDYSINRYINESDLKNNYLEINNLFNNRVAEIFKLINYTIQSSEERILWINEKERLRVQQDSFILDDSKKESLDEIINPKPYKLLDFIIDFIVENYDKEIINEELKKENFYARLTLNKHEFYTKLHLNFLDFIHLNPLKTLIFNILKFNSIISDFYSNYFNLFNHDINIDSISYEKSEPIKTSYISNKKNDLDYFFVHKFKSDILKSNKFKENLLFVNKYLNYFNIGEALEFEETQIRNKKEIEPFIIKNGERKKLYTHYGFGVQLLLPLLMEILFTDSDVLLIEEPESNLHPALQSKLADFFAEISIVYNKQLVIETHSEYIIRRMQYLVANTYYGKNNILPQINSENVNIYYFNDPTELGIESDYTFEINFKKDGGLTKSFGAGFFDVTDDIAYELFMLKNKNLN